MIEKTLDLCYYFLMENDLIEKLIGSFMILPGVGYKTAQRYAYHVLSCDKEGVDNLAHTILEAKSSIGLCSVCGGFCQREVCSICSTRSSRLLCVVKDPKDISVMERVKGLNCLYHVLHGCISPLDNKGPEDIRLKELLQRVNSGDFDEVLVATNPDIEGEATAMYISRLLKPFAVKVTRLAQGISMGSDMEYADEVTLSRAVEARREI